MTPPVSLCALPDYDPARMEAALAELLAPLGGMGAFVRPGQTVLVKPNLLMAKPPAAAVTTHPTVVRAVIRAAQAAGGRVRVGDSPGFGSARKVAAGCGLLAVLEETGADFAPFDESVTIPAGPDSFRHLEVARDLVDADVILNVAKLKTHQMMGYTGAVKNLFGGIVGLRKPGLHLQAGADKGLFARMLLDLCDRLAPALSIIDAVVGMEGDGPSGGTPVALGALIASPSPLAADTVALALAGLAPERCWTQKLARALGRTEAGLDGVTLLGDDLAPLTHAGIRPAKSTEIHFGLPPFLHRPLRHSLTAYPAVDGERCVHCGLCVRHCPPQAMTLDRQVTVDHDRCIGCFCCQELCPEHAIFTRQGLLLRLTRFLSPR